MNIDNNPIGPRLLAWRQAAGLSQRKAATRAGVPYDSWRNWECGRRVPSAGTVAHLEAVINDSGQQTTVKQ